MRFSNVLAVIAALTVSISAMPSVANISSEVNTEDACPVFCSKNSGCFGCQQENCYLIFCTG
ncbi:hypothetical protein P692DRAFT_20729769 [Suillus brevipes Sb2]|nr:hypothetical protein P692DRAFT_20729769 [Suillus brevipes Sb2]